MYQPSIYVSFYYRFLSKRVSCIRIGGGAFSDVASLVDEGGLFVLSSLMSPPGELRAFVGRATIDDETGEIQRHEPRALDADGAPGWLFWTGSVLTARAASYWLRRPSGRPTRSVALWLELDGSDVRELATAHSALECLEKNWSNQWPEGAVVAGFKGGAAELAAIVGNQSGSAGFL